MLLLLSWITAFSSMKRFLCNFIGYYEQAFQLFKIICMIKKYVLLAILAGFVAVSCKQEKTRDQVVEEQVEEIIKEDVKEIFPEEVPENVVTEEIKVFSLKDYVGKYARQEKLFEMEPLAGRLKALNGLDYDIFMALWNVETPISIENNVVHMSGCKQHACPESAYDFFMDLGNDNINIYHFRSNTLRIYSEKGRIDLPPGYAEEIDIKKSNAGIGDTRDVESKYSLTPR